MVFWTSANKIWTSSASICERPEIFLMSKVCSGQASTHRLQSTHLSGSASSLNWPSFSREVKQPEGQRSTQMLHPVQVFLWTTGSGNIFSGISYSGFFLRISLMQSINISRSSIGKTFSIFGALPFKLAISDFSSNSLEIFLKIFLRFKFSKASDAVSTISIFGWIFSMSESLEIFWAMLLAGSPSVLLAQFLQFSQ